MTLRLLISLLLFNLTNSVAGQLSLKNPQICHDRDNFLRCYNDGKYILKFENGNFKEFISVDSSVRYSEADRSITLYRKSFTSALSVDTVIITQLPKSIILKKGTTTIEITSLSNISANISQFNIGTLSINNEVRGLSFSIEGKSFEIEIWTYDKKWSWDIKMWQENQLFAILYNSFKSNRLSHIFVKDFDLKYGMSIGTTFKSLKKISRLQSLYVDTMTIDGRIVIGDYPLDKYYYYDYNRAGKLKSKPLVGELKLCDCD